MPQSWRTWVRKNACDTDRAGGQCIGDDEILTHHAWQRGKYKICPDPEMCEVELSLMRGTLSVLEACQRRNQGNPVPPQDVVRASVRYTTAGTLRRAGFAVIHTCGRKGEGYGHVSAVWPPANPLEEPDPAWPPGVQEAFAACFTEDKG
jgi:hypothetical protein